MFTQLGLCGTSEVPVTALTAVALFMVFRVLGRIRHFVSDLSSLVAKSLTLTVVLDVVVLQ